MFYFGFICINYLACRGKGKKKKVSRKNTAAIYLGIYAFLFTVSVHVVFGSTSGNKLAWSHEPNINGCARNWMWWLFLFCSFLFLLSYPLFRVKGN